MARPAYTNLTDGQVDIDSPITETLLQALRDNAAAVRVQPIYFDGSGVETSTGFTEAFDLYLTVPDIADYTGIQRRLTLSVEAYVNSGAGQVRLRDKTNAVDGTAVDVTATGVGTFYEIAVDIAAGLEGTSVEFAVQGLISTASQITVNATDSWAGFLEF